MDDEFFLVIERKMQQGMNVLTIKTSYFNPTSPVEQAQRSRRENNAKYICLHMSSLFTNPYLYFQLTI